MTKNKKKLIIFGVIGGIALLLVIGYLNLYEYVDTVQYYAPAWSPDGERVIYVKSIDHSKHVKFMGALGWLYLGSEHYICTIDLDGKDEKEIRRIFSSSNVGERVHWHISCFPTNNKITFSIYIHSFNTSDIPREIPGIYTMNADGTNLKRISTTGIQPSWSPDGRQIVYTEGRGIEDIWQNTIWMMNADGTNKHQLLEMKGVHEPAWSPNGDKITFSYGTPRWRGTIWVVNPDGTGKQELTKGGSPIWDPSGTKIIYCAEGGYRMINIDGTGEQLISVYLDEMKLSPNGTKFVGVGDIQGVGGGIVIKNFDGTNPKLLAEYFTTPHH